MGMEVNEECERRDVEDGLKTRGRERQRREREAEREGRWIREV